MSCQGKVFKADVGGSPTKRGFGLFIRMNEMKKLSCPGCDQCGWQSDAIQEAMCDWDALGVVGLESVEDGKLYTLAVTNIGYDYESGMVDEYDVEVVAYENKTA
jgi:hypothetical protein